ncbi:MAG: DUF1080 domain-containing protein [Bryobacteraceae bacterium]|nr:DUF1080 domain-containing protein [Bryobacteraceae bacterium]
MRAVTLAGALAALVVPSHAADIHNSLSPEERGAGWQLLFDGKSMTGWDDPARKSPPGDSWTIEDGCIKALRNPRIREDLFTAAGYGDFELAFDWKISPGGNSGVKYRVQDRAVLEKSTLNPAAKRFEDTVDYELIHRLASRDRIPPGASIEEYVVAFEYQVIDDRAHPDAGSGGKHISGSIYSMVAPAKAAARPAGEFNQSRIVLRGNHVEHWLNGEKVVDTQLDSEEIVNGLVERWTADSPVYRLLTRQPRKKTPIALQNHNDEAWFRAIKIRPLR